MTSPTLAAPARRWTPRTAEAPDPGRLRELTGALRLPEPLCRLLAQRGYDGEDAAKRFLRPRLTDLGDPFGLAGMRGAAERVRRAIEAGETILVHGDYDVDGICAAALYTRVLRELGGRAVPFVPNRRRDGYDLGPAGLAEAVREGASLILTGDCGIVAHEAVAAATDAGLEVVVTDHHTPGETLPGALAVVNPNRSDCGYPEKGLCGAGVAFKLCQALYRLLDLDEAPLWYHLDLVALATIADLVPLTGENRILTHFGLRMLRQTRKPGLRALLRSAAVAEDEELTSRHASHLLGPRLNAAGRMAEAAWGVELLLTEEAAEAERLAERLEEQNRVRQEEDRRTLDEALALLERDFDADRDRAVVVAAEGWHPGVIGIVASRVVERVHRPTVLIALDPDGGPARGSARSVPGFHLYDALCGCAEHLERFGGHRQAAGMDIRPERVDAFRLAFQERARELLTDDLLLPELRFDLELRLAEANAELYRYLRYLGPFGMGNPSPVLVARGVGVAGRPRVVGTGHLKLDLEQDGARLGAIGFRMADRLPEVSAVDGFDVAFQLQEDRWNGRTRLQARLVDLRRTSGG